MSLDRVAGQPTWLLSRAHARAQELLGAAFASADVRGYHYRLLAALAQYGALSQADLGRRTGIDRKDVAVAVAELEADGSVRRDPDSDDARRKVVTLTEAGMSMLDRLDQVLAQVQTEVLAPLTPREQRSLCAMLAKLA